MTKRLWLIACLCLAALTSLADEEKIVRLSDDNKQELLQLGPCNILIVKGETEDGSSAPVTIEIENMQEDEALILFHRSYTEKDLKKSFTPQTTFNKQFPGGSAAHVITKCEELENDVFIRPTDKALLPVSLKATSDEPVKISLPIYVAKSKKKGFQKLELMARELYDLTIEVEVGPDKRFLDLESRCNSLVREIEKKSFCNNPKHASSIEDQEAPYINRIKEMGHEIDEIIKERNLDRGDKAFEKYAVLKDKLNDVNFRERDCGKHGKKSNGDKSNNKKPKTDKQPKCSYCSLSLEQIAKRLESYYKRVYNGQSKSGFIGDVKALYNCAMNHSHGGSGNAKKKVQDYYNRINKAK